MGAAFEEVRAQGVETARPRKTQQLIAKAEKVVQDEAEQAERGVFEAAAHHPVTTPLCAVLLALGCAVPAAMLIHQGIAGSPEDTEEQESSASRTTGDMKQAACCCGVRITWSLRYFFVCFGLTAVAELVGVLAYYCTNSLAMEVETLNTASVPSFPTTPLPTLLSLVRLGTLEF